MEPQKPPIRMIVLVILLLAIGAAAVYFINFRDIKKEAVSSVVEESRINTDTSSWKTYSDSKSLFSIKYPLNLYVKGGGQQFFFVKQGATVAETMEQSDELVEVRTNEYLGRFESYYNAPDNSFVKEYGDIKLRNYAIDGYKAVEYGYDKIKKEKDIEQSNMAVNFGGSVGMIYFNKGLIINKGGNIIEVSTNAYSGEFKDTFDKILSTLRFEI